MAKPKPSDKYPPGLRHHDHAPAATGAAARMAARHTTAAWHRLRWLVVIKITS